MECNILQLVNNNLCLFSSLVSRTGLQEPQGMGHEKNFTYRYIYNIYNHWIQSHVFQKAMFQIAGLYRRYIDVNIHNIGLIMNQTKPGNQQNDQTEVIIFECVSRIASFNTPIQSIFISKNLLKRILIFYGCIITFYTYIYTM